MSELQPPDLGPLQCRNAGCPERSRLGPSGRRDGKVVCGACGAEDFINSVIKPYARITGQWIIGAAAIGCVGGLQLSGASAWIAVGVGAAVGALAIHRIVWQARVLRALKPPKPGP